MFCVYWVRSLVGRGQPSRQGPGVRHRLSHPATATSAVRRPRSVTRESLDAEISAAKAWLDADPATMGSILEQFAELNSDYEIGKASRYKRAKTRIMTLGSHADSVTGDR
jgi:hypothetical protein